MIKTRSNNSFSAKYNLFFINLAQGNPGKHREHSVQIQVIFNPGRNVQDLKKIEMDYGIDWAVFEPLYTADMEELNRIRLSEYNANRAKRFALERACNIKQANTIGYLKDASLAVRVHITMREGSPSEVHLPEQFNGQLFKEQDFTNREWGQGKKQHTLLQDRYKMLVVAANEGFFVNDMHLKDELDEYRRISHENQKLILERHDLINNFFNKQNGPPSDLKTAMQKELERFEAEWGPAGAIVSSINNRNAMRLAAQQDSWVRNIDNLKNHFGLVPRNIKH